MSNRMYKTASFEEELYQSMEKQLVANQVEDTHGMKKLAKAVDYLNAAASIFDQAGFVEEAEAIVDVLNTLHKEEQ